MALEDVKHLMDDMPTPLQDAERKLAIAESVLSAARASQVREREAAEATIAKAQRHLQSLDREIAPYFEAVESAMRFVAVESAKVERGE